MYSSDTFNTVYSRDVQKLYKQLMQSIASEFAILKDPDGNVVALTRNNLRARHSSRLNGVAPCHAQ